MNLIKIFCTIIILCIPLASCKDFQSDDLTFDQNEWKKADYRVRGRMCKSLVTQKILLGQTKNKVLETLGEPDESDAKYIKYAVDLGAIHERWIQKYFLIVIFDEKTQKVVTAAIAD